MDPYLKLVEQIVVGVLRRYGIPTVGASLREPQRLSVSPPPLRPSDCSTVSCVAERYGWDGYLRTLARLCNDRPECVREALDYVGGL